MKVLADIVAGLWSALCIAAEVTWDYGVKFWNSRSETQKSVLLAVAIIVVALGSWQVARAEDQPSSGYGLWHTVDGRGAYACFMNNPKKDTVGAVYTCMVMAAVGPGVFMTQGNVEFCTITGVKNDLPMIDCAGSYGEARTLAGGI